jgi:hypothetical protein
MHVLTQRLVRLSAAADVQRAIAPGGALDVNNAVDAGHKPTAAMTK